MFPQKSTISIIRMKLFCREMNYTRGKLRKKTWLADFQCPLWPLRHHIPGDPPSRRYFCIQIKGLQCYRTFMVLQNSVLQSFYNPYPHRSTNVRPRWSHHCHILCIVIHITSVSSIMKGKLAKLIAQQLKKLPVSKKKRLILLASYRLHTHTHTRFIHYSSTLT